MFSGLRSEFVFLFAVMVLGCGAGCGDDSHPGPLVEQRDPVPGKPVQADECRMGFGECPGAMMCIKGACEPVKGQRVLLTIETAEMPEATNYWVTVSAPGKGVILETSESFSSKEPLWFESTTLYLDKMTDRWILKIQTSGWFTDHLTETCLLEFSPLIFEKPRQLVCGADGKKKFIYSIKPI